MPALVVFAFVSKGKLVSWLQDIACCNFRDLGGGHIDLLVCKPVCAQTIQRSVSVVSLLKMSAENIVVRVRVESHRRRRRKEKEKWTAQLHHQRPALATVALTSRLQGCNGTACDASDDTWTSDQSHSPRDHTQPPKHPQIRTCQPINHSRDIE